MKDTISEITMKALEQLTFRALQESFTQVMTEILVKLDEEIAEKRDKKRFRFHDKKKLSFESVFGRIELKRAYYKDREKGQYVYLLDQYLDFDGSKGMSPVIQDVAMELAVTGVSYRQAGKALEKLLGYQVISHEGIRQQVLNTDILPKEPETVEREVLFVEVDGLYTKSQEKNRKGREVKIASIHQGWEVNGKRTRLKKKRHFIHKGKGPFWEAFEDFLVTNYEYDPTKHHLVINGDGAPWITACRDYFQHNATFVIDRFHIARDVQRIFRDHPRYRSIRKKLAAYDTDGFMVEVNSAVGTIEQEKKEQRLEELIAQLSQYPEALGDYREKLKKKGIETEGFRPMGSAEGMMSVFAKRLKNGRSWSAKGLDKFIDLMVALKDRLEVKTLKGSLNQSLELEEEKRTKKDTKPPKHFVEKLKSSAAEATRNNMAYLQNAIGKPITNALKGLRGF
ncbi:ISLre2 family transposase [Halalkalibacterium halodurans]|uniref:ISLre2 family transposase n=1 Tax=Halalkalibacterium halodurans TaxID=86665 RepID=UPI0010687308|nr:ISLre2 family transposase [Halalkalibacterium halodurans]TES57522.1 ISLre2 family transposase [Halalkalibacterium halodurans]